MGFVGLVPTEYSSGGSTHRGHLTKAGNAHVRAQLIEGAWHYQHRPYVGSVIAKRQQGVAPKTVARAWAAQLRLPPSPAGLGGGAGTLAVQMMGLGED